MRFGQSKRSCESDSNEQAAIKWGLQNSDEIRSASDFTSEWMGASVLRVSYFRGSVCLRDAQLRPLPRRRCRLPNRCDTFPASSGSVVRKEVSNRGPGLSGLFERMPVAGEVEGKRIESVQRCEIGGDLIDQAGGLHLMAEEVRRNRKERKPCLGPR
jgi:hypothetical protein